MQPNPILLVVEDEPDIAELIRMEFSMAGWIVQCCESADEAIKVAMVLHPDVAIVDVLLPGYLDGFELCRRIKQHDSLAATSVIVLTALDRETQRMAGKLAGCDAYVAKPFSPAELLRLANQLR